MAVSCYLTTSFHTHQNPSTKSVSPFQDCDMGNDRYVVEICGTRFQSPFSSTHDSSICIGSLERTKIWPIFGLPGGKQPHFVTSSPGRFPEIRCSETTRPRKEGANIHTSRNQDSTCPRNRRGDCLDASHFEIQLPFTLFQHENKVLGTPRAALTAIHHTHDLPLST